MLLLATVFLMGIMSGFVVWSWLASKDQALIKLMDDEVVIKRPDPNMMLVQVTPEVARRLVYSEGAEEKTTLEARKLYRG